MNLQNKGGEKVYGMKWSSKKVFCIFVKFMRLVFWERNLEAHDEKEEAIFELGTLSLYPGEGIKRASASSEFFLVEFLFQGGESTS